MMPGGEAAGVNAFVRTEGASVSTGQVSPADEGRTLPLAVIIGVAFVVLLAIAVAATGLIGARLEGDKERVQSEEFLRSKAQQYANVVAATLDRRMRTLALVATRPEWPAAFKDPAVAAQMLALLRPSVPMDGWVGFADLRGRVIAASGYARERKDVAARAWFGDGLRGPRLRDARSEIEPGVLPRPGTAEARSLATLVHPVRDRDGSVIGVLAEHMDAGVLEQLAALDALARGVRFDYGVAVVDDDGTVLAASQKLPERLPLPSQMARAPREAWTVSKFGDHPALLLAASPFAGSEAVRGLGWSAVAFAALPDVEKNVSDAQWRSLALAAGIASLLLPLVLLLANRIARPVRRLTQALEEVRALSDAGPARIPIAGPRETVALGRAARTMLTELSAREAEIRQSAARYRELFEIHPLPMWVVDEETLGFLEVNRATLRKYGFSRDEFLAMTVVDLGPADAREAVVQAFRNTRQEQQQNWALWQHQLRSGERIDVEINSQQIQWFGRKARIATVIDVTDQRRAALEVSRHRRELSELASRLMTTEESERRVLAQVLHDRYAPSLYGVKLGIEALLARAARIDDVAALRAEVARALAPAVQALEISLGDVRGLMSDLRPPLLADHGLRAGLRFEVQRRSAESGEVEIVYLPATVAVDAPSPRQAETDEYALFMIAREALQNSLAHAAAQRIEIDLVEEKDRVVLTVRDDGKGFDSEAAPPAGHLGLVGMRERARWIGAELAIDSRPGHGTEVLVAWRAKAKGSPLVDPAREAEPARHSSD